jgi:hypothetical protein
MVDSITRHAAQIARALLGKSNKKLSTQEQLRFGTNGSLAVEVAGGKAGQWYDHEHEVGGGMLDLVRRERSCDKAAALAWLQSELGIEAPSGNGGAGEPQRRITAYVYKDEAGQPLFCVSRWGPLKTFTQERYDPAGGTFHGGKGCMKDVRLVPYRLDEWLTETNRIWIVEGEKDADRLANLGLLATTNPGGAGKWSASFTKYFTGRDVAIIPDNDEAGRAHARDVAANLKPVARSVQIVELPALLPKQDVSDFLDHGHTLATLEKLLTAEPSGETTEAETARPVADAAALLDDVQAFLARFVSYPSAEASVAHTLWIAHAHLMEAWESTPRIAFLSPEPASGKTRALEVSELLVPRAVEAVNVSPAYLFRKVVSDDGAPTILFDEIDTVFGPKAKDNEEIRALLNAGHRRGAVTGRCVVRGKIVETEEIPAYCAVALAGLGWLPDTLMTRAVVIRMRRRAPSEQIEPYRRRVHAAAGLTLRASLEAWAAKVINRVTDAWPEMPDGIEDRDADVWEALLSVADVAGGDWPRRARAAAVALVTEAKDSTPSLGVRLLGDLRTVFDNRDVMATKDILAALIALDESPWSDLKGKPLNARGLAVRLQQYGVKRKLVRIDEWVGRGYARADLADAWSRYLPPLPARESVTSVTKVTDTPKPKATANSGVTDPVTDSGAVTDRAAGVTDRVTEADPLKARETADVTFVTDVTDLPGADGPGERIGSCAFCFDAVFPDDVARAAGAMLHRRCADLWSRPADPPAAPPQPGRRGPHVDICGTCSRPVSGLMVKYKDALHHQSCLVARP